MAKWQDFLGDEDLIFLTVANYGYKDLLINFFASFHEVYPSGTLHVMTYDEKLMKEMLPSQMKMWIVADYPKLTNRVLPSDSIAFKKDQWNTVTRFKLMAMWKLLEAHKRVFYCDPDIVFLRSPLDSLERLDKSRFWIQSGSPYCSGVMYVTPETHPDLLNLLNPKMWLESPFDDENYLKDSMTRKKAGNQELSLLEFQLFPNGAVWKRPDGWETSRQWIGSRHSILFHFNFLVGVDAKIQRMKDLGCWLID